VAVFWGHPVYRGLIKTDPAALRSINGLGSANNFAVYTYAFHSLLLFGYWFTVHNVRPPPANSQQIAILFKDRRILKRTCARNRKQAKKLICQRNVSPFVTMIRTQHQGSGSAPRNYVSCDEQRPHSNVTFPDRIQ